ncbi:MAG TPA: glycosyltransferase family 39 protein [Verrucomicrobiae bacterium]|nr:glycosyltransferase family 39 protein [Verrucomicrobiae bacterium]
MKVPEPLRCMVLLLVFAVVFGAITVGSYVRESATWDEPQHLVAGYCALKFHDYRTDPEHPPLIRMWAALPLLGMDGIKIDLQKIDPLSSTTWVMNRQFFFCHDTLYLANDADHLLYAARFMIVLLGVLLGVLVFCWARELFGFWPAAIVLGFYTIEPNLLAHCRLVTTDFGVACFTFGTAYFLWRTTRRLSAGNLLSLIAFFALAQAGKFSAVLLGPIVLVLLAARALCKSPWPLAIGQTRQLTTRRVRSAVAGSVFAAMVFTAWVGIWAAYDFRFLPSDTPGWRMEFQKDPVFLQRMPALTQAVTWVDEHHLLPNAYNEGFLLGQVKAQKRSAFLAGSYRTDGWWWFFPFAFLIKTPIAVIALFAAGALVAVSRWRRLVDDVIYILLPPGTFLVAAMAAKLNIGLRHVLPVYPFALLLAGYAIAKLSAARSTPRRFALVALGLLAVAEFVLVCPHYLAFFNGFVGGPRHGQEYLVDSNLDWGQDLKGLKEWMDHHDVHHINLAYFGTADPAYYKMDCTYLLGGPFFDDPQLGRPILPGYVAVSATNLRGLYLPDQWRGFYMPLLDREPAAVIGFSIYVYWVDQVWWR